MLRPKPTRSEPEESASAQETIRRYYAARNSQAPGITPRDLFLLAIRVVGLYFLVRSISILLQVAAELFIQRDLTGSAPLLLNAMLNGVVSLYFILGGWPLCDWAYPATKKADSSDASNAEDQAHLR